MEREGGGGRRYLLKTYHKGETNSDSNITLVKKEVSVRILISLGKNREF